MSSATLPFLPPTVRVRSYAGDDTMFRILFYATDQVLPIVGTHLAQIRPDKPSVTVLATFTIDDSLAAEGELIFKLPHADATIIPVDTACYWDLQWTTPEGTVLTLLQGTFTLQQDVTRTVSP